ncbi:MAG: phosphomannomutase/phosphoglucomutase [Alphaproteobacteria bacterium]|nr:phosphomannomutase/phosphoglucomutase [Alphaproteobacteria bacterium]
MQAHQFDKTLLREYDVRGVVGKTLFPADAKALGAAYATYIGKLFNTKTPSIAIGYDGRLSSTTLEAALLEGLLSAGAKVTRVGLGPTPMLYFAVKHFGLDAGIMITGSHNPPDYNGFKMLTKIGPIYGAMIKDIGAIAEKGEYISGAGTQETKDVRELFVARLLKDYDGIKHLKIVWDAGNGSAGEILRMMTAKMPGEHILLFDDIDGTFPNHHPDPTVEENLHDLRKHVAKHKAHIGIGFDGDGDRIGAIDEHGRVVAGDQLLALYAGDVLRKHPGATIIADVKASETIFDDIRANGGNALMWKTGHSLLKAKMAETKSPLAGEMSGHIFFADKYYGYDDALYAGIRLAGLVSREGGSLGKMRDRLPAVFNTPEIRVNSSEERKFKVVEEVKARLKQAGANVNDIDGVRVKTKDGWWLLRASNTQDVLVARAEALTQKGLDNLKAELIEQLKLSGITETL